MVAPKSHNCHGGLEDIISITSFGMYRYLSSFGDFIYELMESLKLGQSGEGGLPGTLEAPQRPPGPRHAGGGAGP